MATERPATQAKRILVVEDEPMIRMLLEDMLGELGYTIAAEAGDRIGEPVSAPNSLLTGKLTGNFAESDPPLRFRQASGRFLLISLH